MGINFIRPTAKWNKRISSPADLSPFAWYDASSSGSVIESGGLASQWSDISGNGKHLTQPTSAAMPTTGTTQNGLPVLGFATSVGAAPLYLTASTASDWTFLHDGTENLILAAAAKPMTGINSLGVIFGNHSSNVANIGASLGLFSISGTTFVSRINHVITGVGGQITSLIGDSTTHTTLGTGLGVWQSGSVFHDVLNKKYFRFHMHPYNDFRMLSMTANAFSATVAQPLRVGTLNTATTSNTSKWVGYIGEIVIVRGANATPENAFALREYLRQKWGTL